MRKETHALNEFTDEVQQEKEEIKTRARKQLRIKKQIRQRTYPSKKS